VIPIETYLRLMYLKYRYRLDCKTLCKEVADSLAWRRFCRIGLDARVADPSTPMKLTERLGPWAARGAERGAVGAGGRAEALRSRRLRVDTTMVESDPALSDRFGPVRTRGLAADAACRRLPGGGLAPRTRLRDRLHSIGTRVPRIWATAARGGKTRTTVDRLTGEIAERAHATVREAQRVVRNARRTLAKRLRPGAGLVAQLEQELAATPRPGLDWTSPPPPSSMT
jgi:IS5 family transposase